MSIINVNELKKTYKTFKKEKGISASIKSLFSRKYEYVNAVNNINFSINKGEFVGFIGPNGAGKTTTIKMLSGILHPTDGNLNVLNYNPFDKKRDFLKQIALVSAQKTQLWWDIPAQDSFSLLQTIYDVDKKTAYEQINYLSSFLKVKELLEIPIRNLSLGERMKMELIGSLLHKPKILFLDEPSIGLDFISRQDIRNFLSKYNRESGATIILTSHYLEDIKELCKRIIIINNGVIIYDGKVDDIYNNYKDKVIFRLITQNIEKYKKLCKDKIIGEADSYIDILIEKDIESIFLSEINKNNDAKLEFREFDLEYVVRDYYGY